MNLFRVTAPMVLQPGDYMFADAQGIIHRVTPAMLEAALASKPVHTTPAPVLAVHQPHVVKRTRKPGHTRVAVEQRRARVAELLEQIGRTSTDEMVTLLGLADGHRGAVYHDLRRLREAGKATCETAPDSSGKHVMYFISNA